MQNHQKNSNADFDPAHEIKEERLRQSNSTGGIKNKIKKLPDKKLSFIKRNERQRSPSSGVPVEDKLLFSNHVMSDTDPRRSIERSRFIQRPQTGMEPSSHEEKRSQYMKYINVKKPKAMHQDGAHAPDAHLHDVMHRLLGPEQEKPESKDITIPSFCNSPNSNQTPIVDATKPKELMEPPFENGVEESINSNQDGTGR